jgi:hypothetical protein
MHFSSAAAEVRSHVVIHRQDTFEGLFAFSWVEEDEIFTAIFYAKISGKS